ncbi:MAG: DNA-3-methyladenine glycosylase [Thermoplasmata archaeon]|nr:DNA-3-methyladenine glycosylase [Thermoplasmata archaeon]
MRPGQAALSRSDLRSRYDRPLDGPFYDRTTTVVARELLGAWLVAPVGRAFAAARIVETEAYVATDPASHAYRGRTTRNASMFGAPGTLYVYRIHQVHCANAVTRPGEAVLLRAAEPLTEGMGNASGPGRLARAFDLTRSDDGSSLTEGRVRMVPGDDRPARVTRSPRIGISKATERPLRFSWTGHPNVSRPRPWARGASTA